MTTKWQEARVKRAIHNELVKLVKKNKRQIDTIQELVATLIATNDTKNEQHIVVMLCTAIIAGFDDKEEQNMVVRLIEETVKNYDPR